MTAKPAGCGTCTLCCKVMAVTDLDPPKPANEWCRHCDVGRGCSIYAERPTGCRIYDCIWLQTQGTSSELPAELRPDRCKVVINTLGGQNGLAFMVDPGRPDAYKVGAIAAFIRKVNDAGPAIVVAVGDKRTLIEGRKPDAGRRPGL